VGAEGLTNALRDSRLAHSATRQVAGMAMRERRHAGGELADPIYQRFPAKRAMALASCAGWDHNI